MGRAEDLWAPLLCWLINISTYVPKNRHLRLLPPLKMTWQILFLDWCAVKADQRSAGDPEYHFNGTETSQHICWFIVSVCVCVYT